MVVVLAVQLVLVPALAVLVLGPLVGAPQELVLVVPSVTVCVHQVLATVAEPQWAVSVGQCEVPGHASKALVMESWEVVSATKRCRPSTSEALELEAVVALVRVQVPLLSCTGHKSA